MFMERGFDAVRVTEIAEACGVSEKTVFNYFPTKESLILDRLESTMVALKDGLADPAVSPVQAALTILDGELGAMTSWLASQEDPVQASAAIRRFGGLWRIQYQALPKYLDGIRTPAQVHLAVTADVRRAADLVAAGLNSFQAFTA
jgi:AcrR family transcriptional regulator